MTHPFDQHYFHGGAKVGGYAGEGYRDFGVHEVTAAHVLARKPESVLELGCARGYVLKRIEDAGVRVCGLEISEHCYLTRVVNNVFTCDITKTKWPVDVQIRDTGTQFDLCLSVAVLEHIPEDKLPAVLAEMARTCKRGLHGIDVHDDDGFDQTHCTIRPIEWWRERLPSGHEAVDKEELERETGWRPATAPGLKLNLGSFTTMFWGWTNIDALPLHNFARANSYAFRQWDLRGEIPFDDNLVELVYASHFIEHLTYKEGERLLREIHRVLKPGGLARILVPDLQVLAAKYVDESLADFDELGSAAPSQAERLYNLLAAGHQAFYDADRLRSAFVAAGFHAQSVVPMTFRASGSPIMLRETHDMLPDLSLIVEAIK